MHVSGKGSRLGQYQLPISDTISEPEVVARGDDAAEGEAGRVALVQLGHRVPDGFHGNWVGAA